MPRFQVDIDVNYGEAVRSSHAFIAALSQQLQAFRSQAVAALAAGTQTPGRIQAGLAEQQAAPEVAIRQAALRGTISPTQEANRLAEVRRQTQQIATTISADTGRLVRAPTEAQVRQQVQALERRIQAENAATSAAEQMARAERDAADIVRRRAAIEAAAARIHQGGLEDRPVGVAGAELRHQAELAAQADARRRELGLPVPNRGEPEAPLDPARVEARLLHEREQARRAAVEQDARALAAAQLGVEANVAAAKAKRQAATTTEASRLRELIADEAYNKATAETAVEQRRLQSAIRRAEQNYAATTRGPGAQGTLFQQLQQYIHQRQGGEARDSTEYLRLGQFLTSRLITTAGFAVSGALLYGGVSSIKSLLQEAEELDRTLNQIERQFEESDDAAQFPRARQAILDIARGTGEAANDVATVFFQFRGAFGDTTRAIDETRAAIELTRVTGLSLTEVVDSLTATALTFDTSIAHIGDTALGLQERFGVLARQTVTFVADLAPVANEVGLSLEKVAALGAVAQQVSGRSGTALAESFGRVLPAIGEAQTAILDLYNTTPALQGKKDLILEALASGQTGVVFEQLIRDYDKLSESQQNYVISLLGGRREAQALIPVLQNSAKLVAEWDRTTSDAGKTEQYFADLQNTVQQRIARLGETFRQLGEALFRGGLGQGIQDTAAALTFLVSLLRNVVEAFNGLNEATNGWAGRLLVAAGIARVLSAALSALVELRKKHAEAALLEAAAQRTNIVYSQAEAGAAANVARAKGIEVAAVNGAAAADLYEAGTSARNAEANLAQAGSAAYGGGAAARFRGANVPGPTAPPAAAHTFGQVAGSAAGQIITFIAVQQVFSAVQEQRGKVDAAEADLTEKIKAASDADLKKFLESETKHRRSLKDRILRATNPANVIDDLGVNPFDKEDPKDQVREELVRRAAKSIGERTSEALVNDLADLNDKQREVVRDAYLKSSGLDEFTAARFVDKDILEVNEEGINKLINDATKNGSQAALDALTEINRLVDLDPAARQKLNELTAKAGETAAATALASAARLEEVRTQYQGGLTDVGTYLAALDREIALNKQLQDAGDTRSATAEALAKLRAERQKLIDQYIQDSSELRRAILAGTGHSDPTVELNELLAEFNNPALSQQSRYALVADLFDALQRQYQERLDSAATAAERLKILDEGFVIPPELRRAAIGAQLELDPHIKQFIDTAAKITGQTVEAITNQMIDGIITLGVGANQVMIDLLNKQIEILRRKAHQYEHLYGREEAESIYQQINQLAAEVAGLSSGADSGTAGIVDPGTTGQATDVASAYQQTAKDVRAEALAREKAFLAIRRAEAAGDEVLLAQLDAQEAALEAQYADPGVAGDTARLEARAHAIEAAQRARKADLDLQRAAIELREAGAANDAVGAARIAAEAAALAVGEAQEFGGDAAELRAAAAAIRANQQVTAAIQDVFAAQHELLATIAEVSGDQVQAAREHLVISQQRLADLIANGGGEAEVARAQAEVVRSRAQLRDSELSTRNQQIDVALQLGRITVQQAIAQLQALLSIPGLTVQQTNEVLLKIKQLKDQLSSDLAFNQPSEIDTPTLYEVRRQIGASQAGQGYQDNRTHIDQRHIEVTLTASTDAQVDRAAAQILDAIDAPPREGDFAGVFP